MENRSWDNVARAKILYLYSTIKGLISINSLSSGRIKKKSLKLDTNNEFGRYTLFTNYSKIW